MKRYWATIVLSLGIILASQPSFSQTRIALVTSNSDHPNLGALKNPANDARLMAPTLRSIGFEAIDWVDANKNGRKKAVKAFGLFCYADYWVQICGQYNMESSNVVVQGDAVQDNMEFAGNELNIIVMGACRNNQFKRKLRAASSGLARMDASKGNLTTYAKFSGDDSTDGKESNSPYTETLAQAALNQGVNVERSFKEVRNHVVEVTNTIGGSPKLLKPGDTFKDCNECPEMIVVPSGNLLMGSTTSEAGRYADEGPQHRVTLSSPFAVGIYEVTQAEWQSVMGTNPSRYKGDRRPVETVSWDEIQAYLKKLNARTGETYRLLSESEWEYVARAGTTTRFNCGDRDSCLGTMGWFGSNSGNNTHPVGGKRANQFGLHDMHGNVWEWTQDCWYSTYIGAPSNGSARSSDNCSKRVLRGGSWSSTPRVIRSANRNWSNSGNRYSGDGFRLAKSLTEAELQ